ncbi:MAG: hypothetical protein MZV64_49755 [Ignavibacteriales bacterium]|nr:hypothetical protein [Ignavibacteriales bacterium]
MSPARIALPQAFKRAVVVSAFLHAGLLILIAASPSFTRSQPKGLVQYVNFMRRRRRERRRAGRGPAGGGEPAAAKTEPLPARREAGPARPDRAVQDQGGAQELR